MKKKETLSKMAEEATKMVIEALDKGAAVWTEPWTIASGDHGIGNKRAYRGVNLLTTAAAKLIEGYKSSAWLTWSRYKKLQAEDPSICMKKGSKGIYIIYWIPYERTDDEGNPVLDENGCADVWLSPKLYKVYNADCFENLDINKIDRIKELEVSQVASAEEKIKELLSSYSGCPAVCYIQDGRAFYTPSRHQISIPEIKYFKSDAEAYSTVAHELVHSTGKALGRDQSGWFGDQKYSYEELVAECGATMLCAHAGYLERTVDNNAAYLKNWVSRLKEHPSWLMDAMKDAEKAVSLILGDASAALYAKEKNSEELSEITA